MKRCKDCKYMPWYMWLFRMGDFCNASGVAGITLYELNHDSNCNYYRRKFWKFWRPK